ncbi:hypothetical protein MN116_002636 [Schistosoma mekongi]|uniref:Uncharacterized protein n=1 Tax=Schistosoma mekongi TaxID=38744 RepID=A0AAE1ZGR4_SCHME|nr:hypothetical protein MN116_002636 [Schistosoma mekongi]
MSENYTSTPNQWNRNKALIVPENYNSLSLPYNFKEKVSYAPISNYNTLINLKSFDYSQNPDSSPCHLKQSSSSSSLIQKYDTDMSKCVMTPQIPKSIKNYQPINETIIINGIYA